MFMWNMTDLASLSHAYNSLLLTSLTAQTWTATRKMVTCPLFLSGGSKLGQFFSSSTRFSSLQVQMWGEEYFFLCIYLCEHVKQSHERCSCDLTDSRTCWIISLKHSYYLLHLICLAKKHRQLWYKYVLYKHAQEMVLRLNFGAVTVNLICIGLTARGRWRSLFWRLVCS